MTTWPRGGDVTRFHDPAPTSRETTPWVLRLDHRQQARPSSGGSPDDMSPRFRPLEVSGVYWLFNVAIAPGIQNSLPIADHRVEVTAMIGKRSKRWYAPQVPARHRDRSKPPAATGYLRARYPGRICRVPAIPSIPRAILSARRPTTLVCRGPFSESSGKFCPRPVLSLSSIRRRFGSCYLTLSQWVCDGKGTPRPGTLLLTPLRPSSGASLRETREASPVPSSLTGSPLSICRNGWNRSSTIVWSQWPMPVSEMAQCARPRQPRSSAPRDRYLDPRTTVGVDAANLFG